jgi:hypothetical protein
VEKHLTFVQEKKIHSGDYIPKIFFVASIQGIIKTAEKIDKCEVTLNYQL